MASDDATFLSSVIKLSGYVPETKQQTSPRPKKVRQMKSKVKYMVIIFFDIKGIVHKKFILGRTNN
jgi:accessory gene regulator protein AgrB